MAKTPAQAAVGTIQSGLDPILKEQGFRKDARTYRRATPEGLVHIINFQMSVYGTAEKNSFTVNLGVYIPEVWRLRNPDCPIPAKPKEVDCSIRVRLGHLSIEGRDIWWDTTSAELARAEISSLLTEVGFPFFERFYIRDAILDELPRAAITDFDIDGNEAAAAIFAHRGETQVAADVLRAAIREVEGRRPPRLVSENKLIARYHRCSELLDIKNLLLP